MMLDEITKKVVDAKMDEVRKGKAVVAGIYDVCFKSIMDGCREYLASLIANILEMPYDYVLENLEVSSTEHDIMRTSDRPRRSDFMVAIKNKHIIIEAYKGHYSKAIAKKNLTYAFRSFEKSLSKDNEIMSRDIEVYEINFDAMKMGFIGDDELTMHTFETREIHKGYPHPYAPKIIYIDLAKIKKKYYNKEKLDEIERLALLLILTSKEELRKVSKGDQIMEKVVNKLENLSSGYLLSDAELEAFDEYEKKTLREEGIEEGIEQGIEKGRNERDKEYILNMHENGVSVSDIARYSGLSQEEIEKIINEGK